MLPHSFQKYISAGSRRFKNIKNCAVRDSKKQAGQSNWIIEKRPVPTSGNVLFFGYLSGYLEIADELRTAPFPVFTRNFGHKKMETKGFGHMFESLSGLRAMGAL